MIVQSYHPRSIWFHPSWIGWTSTAVLFMIDPSMSAISYVVFISLIFSTLLSISAPLLSLYLLPLPLMMGPVFILPIEGFGSVTSGDLYTVILIGRTLFLRGVNIKESGQLFLILCGLLLVLCTVFSHDLGSSVIGLAKILQYALLIRASIILIKHPSDLRNLITGWVFITTLCVIIMFWHYYNGRPQLIFWPGDSETSVGMDLDRFDIFYRTTFFYANVWIPIGLSFLFSLMSILMRIETNGFKIFLLCIAIPVNYFALLMNNTRAMFVPVTLLGGLVILWNYMKSLTLPKMKLQIVVFLILITGVSTWLFSEHLITEPQRIALFERAYDIESFSMRWSVWASVLPKMLNDPFRLLVGWGPQSTTRQVGEDYMQELLTGNLGNTEGAFDSTIVGFLVEYGIIFSLFVLAYIFYWFSVTWNYYKLKKDSFTSILLIMAIALVIAHIFQQFGVGPPGLMALQLLAFLPNFNKIPRTVVLNRCAESAEN